MPCTLKCKVRLCVVPISRGRYGFCNLRHRQNYLCVPNNKKIIKKSHKNRIIQEYAFITEIHTSVPIYSKFHLPYNRFFNIQTTYKYLFRQNAVPQLS